MALRTTLLVSTLFATFWMLCSKFLWGLSTQDLSSRQNQPVVSLFLVISACAGLGGGLLVYVLTGKVAQAREKIEE